MACTGHRRMHHSIEHMVGIPIVWVSTFADENSEYPAQFKRCGFPAAPASRWSPTVPTRLFLASRGCLHPLFFLHHQGLTRWGHLAVQRSSLSACTYCTVRTVVTCNKIHPSNPSSLPHLGPSSPECGSARTQPAKFLGPGIAPPESQGRRSKLRKPKNSGRLHANPGILEF